ncbi:cytochrome-c peroxidase [Hymenobacter sp. BT18]|uniref:cytochrome-c peroxidase n=1 Tax=Hymenobacter sp. BT18 TaxID=2835648 RepID=UPI00143E212C|nr:cytochrome c peroxidase [Hymenobacter sp. BT18]QIX62791.1 cytochrome-c peroxidase [Hymenobacter sp. BT18]
MWPRLFQLTALALAGNLWLAACGQAETATPVAEVPGVTVPGNFPAPVYAAEANPPTLPAFELGRALFYDPQLSRTKDVSCGSCHQQFAAFAHADHRVSHGVDNRLGTRNAPPLQNLRWRRDLLWDGGAKHLETMPLAPLTNPVEMDETLENVLRTLNADAKYVQQFAQVYGKKPIDSQQFLKALAQFTAALTSSNSRYDHYARGEAGGTLSAAEVRGLTLLRQKCSACHGTDLFTDESYRNNGLAGGFALDSGRAHITRQARDRGRFKVPSLRNVARTAPYMHDGRFETLTQVLAHYDHGVTESATLDPLLRQPDGRLGIPLTSAEQADLLAFLATLTDEQFLHDPRLSEKPR